MSIAKKESNGVKTEAERENTPNTRVPSKERDQLGPKIIGEKVWCPFCNEYTQFIKSASAARVANISRRTIYRYIEEGLVFAVRVAGKSYRVCSSCLLKRVQ